VLSLQEQKQNKIQSTESMEQIGFVRWFRSRYPGLLIFHIPNGGARHIVTGKKLKDEGVVAGVPDLFIPAWNCWIEMKRKEYGVLSFEQTHIHKYLEGIGHTVIIGYGAEDASRKLLQFRNI
jgi:hypothetical protein